MGFDLVVDPVAVLLDCFWMSVVVKRADLLDMIKVDPAFAWGVPELVHEIKPEEMDIPIKNKR